jgi:hypothetical protein
MQEDPTTLQTIWGHGDSLVVAATPIIDGDGEIIAATDMERPDNINRKSVNFTPREGKL